MPRRTFDYCALQFLNQWLAKEQALCKLLASSVVESQKLALYKAGGYFSIARNLPIRFETENNMFRYQPVLDTIQGIEKVSKRSVTDVVERACNKISYQYGGRSVLSLTTKFLWLKFKSPIRIYDKQARAALKTKVGDFAAFNEAFSELYAEKKDSITRACSKLERVRSYSIRPDMEKREIKNLVSKRWFKERVLDIYLWNEGNS